MKFGKKIQNAAAVSTSLCSPDCWMNYKASKKLLKTFEVSEDANARVDTEEQKTRSISKSDDERRFFMFLKRELGKVTRVFTELERRSMAEFVNLLSALERPRSRKSEAASGDTLTQFAELHGRLILLRNFAVMNYVGFTKILKKHDKLTGYKTRDKYMMKMVDDQPFSHHTTLKRGLEIMELEYEHIKATGTLSPGLSAGRLRSFRAQVDADKNFSRSTSGSTIRSNTSGADLHAQNTTRTIVPPRGPPKNGPACRANKRANTGPDHYAATEVAAKKFRPVGGADSGALASLVEAAALRQQRHA